MKKILYFVVVVVLPLLIGSCKTTTETITTTDTLTITRDSVVYIHSRDTLTITQDRDRDIIKYVYDTAQRVREVVKIYSRDHYKEEQGKAATKVVHDTVTIQAGGHTEKAKQTKPAKAVNVWAVGCYVLFVIMLIITGYAVYLRVKNKRINSKMQPK